MACLRLLAQNGYAEKRVAYLALTLLLDERQEVLMLVTNSVKHDLQQKNQYIAALALSALGSIGSAEMCRDCQPEVTRLTMADQPYIAKKAALAACRILRKIPDHAEDFIEASAKLLKSRHHGSLLAGVQLSTRLCELVPDLALMKLRERSFLPLAIKILKGMISSKDSVDHKCGGVSDPFLQVWLLRLIRILRADTPQPAEDDERGQLKIAAWHTMNEELCDVLATVSSMDSSSGAAVPAVMYEAVNTILFSGVGSAEGLRVMAINVLGKFLSMKDNNLRYVALHMLAKVVASDPQAVQRHRRIILECVKDADSSIRRKALELVCALVNGSNVAVLIKELVDYLRVAEKDFLEDLTAKVCGVAVRYAPDDNWLIDALFEIFDVAGLYVPEHYTHLLCGCVSRGGPELQASSIERAIAALGDRDHSFVGVPRQLGTAVLWILGEFGADSDSANTLLMQVVSAQLAPSWAKELATVSLAKIASRSSSSSMASSSGTNGADTEEVIRLLASQAHSLSLEVQTRSTELSSLLTLSSAGQVLEAMPVMEAKDDESKSGVDGASGGRSGSISMVDAPIMSVEQAVGSASLVSVAALDAPAAPAPAAAAAPVDLMDLLDMGGDVGAAPDAAAAPAPTTAPPSDPMALFDMLNTNGSSPAMPAVAVAPSPPAFAPPAQSPGLVGIESAAGLRVTLAKVDGPMPGSSVVTATALNSGAGPITEYVLQVAVPKFIQLRIDPASSNVVPPGGTGTVTQSMHITNSMHGQKPVALRLRASFRSAAGVETVEQGQLTFPLP